MHKIAILIKTYKPDFDRVKMLLASIEQFNADAIPVYISINDDDFSFFKQHLKTHATLLKDSDIYHCKITDPWRYQQVIKTNFYRLNVAENYLCIDSDSQFIKEFRISDFMYDDDTPYTIMHESKSFLEMAENIGMDSQTIFFKQAVDVTRKLLGTHGKYWDYGPSPYLWSCKVWRHFNEVYLAGKGLSFEDFFEQIIKEVPPSETVIYGEYLLKERLIEIYPVEGFFKVYHFSKQYSMEKKHHDIEKLKKIYLGVIFQSNWHGHKNLFSKFFNKLFK
ncbi:hypothetical protein CHU92_11575 [Flavobacterium cyanobacteriorum]|uniref:Nucleotide-diphospho-sugar transferase domain-containing protein n=1 Tax=Flavobacterium cyanobacteriorum TaxID=2022802 RepID=A0A255YZM5_9FLAO|nr:DUF6492 family protein [Flavobacterium cyanobacteriorum]OYQ34666.1 hypothetical protein CHU92_11575 [Flavobacterium cyanobacteriorum]